MHKRISPHGDFDHMGWSINLVNNFKVENVIFNCGEYNDLEQELIKVLDKKKIKYYSCIKELNIDKYKLQFLNAKEYDNENDNSNVVYLNYDGYKFLFMGDAGIDKEKDILGKYNLKDIDFLKVGHHGSNTSSSEYFINKINPKYSLISVGKNNRYGHPKESVLDILSNSKIYRKDLDGPIEIKLNKNGYKMLKLCYNNINYFAGDNMLVEEVSKYINKFLKIKNISDYIGIIVYGSYVSQKNNDLSDIDIMIVKKNYETQDCGSITIDGTRIEFFVQDIKKLYYLIENEIENNNPSHLTKFSTCEILIDNTGELTEFINYVKQIYNTPIKPEFTEKEKFSIFSINNRIEDLYNLLDKDSFHALYFDILERIRNVYSKINGIIELPLSKIQMLYTDSEYANNYIRSDIHKLPNEKFISMYLECLKIEDKNIMLNKISQLYEYCFSKMEFNPNNFTLKYKKESPFRV